jgi:hypothetical protein
MLKLLRKGLLLVAVLYVTTVLIAGLDNRHKISDSNILRIKAAERSGSLDVLFVGSSYVYSGIMTPKFDSAGVSSFNLGIATTGAFYTQLLAEDFLRASNTKTICISIAYTTFSDLASDVWHQYPVHRYLNPPLSNEKVFLKYGGIESYFQMYRSSFRKGISNIGNKTEGVDSGLLKDIVMTKGYEISCDTVTPELLSDEKKIFEDYRKSIFSERKARVFNAVIDTCIKHGISVILIEPPTYHLRDYFNEQYIKKYNQFKIELKKRTPIIECNNLVFDDTCFRNTDHMNVNGASKYTMYLLKQFKKER